MNTYTTMLFLLSLIGIFALARIALKYLRTSTILRQICRQLIVTNFILRRKPLTATEVDEELARLFEKYGKED